MKLDLLNLTMGEIVREVLESKGIGFRKDVPQNKEIYNGGKKIRGLGFGGQLSFPGCSNTREIDEITNYVFHKLPQKLSGTFYEGAARLKNTIRETWQYASQGKEGKLALGAALLTFSTYNLEQNLDFLEEKIPKFLDEKISEIAGFSGPVYKEQEMLTTFIIPENYSSNH